MSGLHDKDDSTIFSWVPSWLKNVGTPCVAIGCGIAGVLAFNWTYDQLKRKWNNYPPGPTGFPLIGSVLSMMKDERKYFLELNDEYKYISMYYMFRQPIVCIHDSRIMKEYFKKEQFSDRPQSKIFLINSFLNLNWKQIELRRKILIHSLVSQAQRSNKLYQLIGDNIIKNTVFKQIENCIQSNTKWNIRKEARFVTFSTIYGSILNQNLDIDDQVFEEYIQLLDKFFKSWIDALILDTFMPSKMIENCAFVETQKKMIKIVGKWVNHKINEINTTQQLQSSHQDNHNNHHDHDHHDYISQLLNYFRQEKINNLDGIIGDVNNVFIAGTHTTSKSIEQGVLYLAKYPQIQEIIYQEFIAHKVNENNQYQNIKSFSSCIIFKAFIHEVLRFNSSVLISLDRAVNNNTLNVKEKCDHDHNNRIKYYDEEKQCDQHYNIPENAHIVADICTQTHDCKQFYKNNINARNKFEFNIFNWLVDKDININKIDANVGLNAKSGDFGLGDGVDCKKYKFNDSKYLPIFGCGHRSCAGQILAKNELYLFLGMLILNYQFVPPDNISPKDFYIPPNLSSSKPTIGVMCQRRQINKQYHGVAL